MDKKDKTSPFSTLSSLVDTIWKTIAVPLHPAGRPFILIAGIIVVGAFLLSEILGVILLMPGLFVVYFFRDPVRTVPQKEGLIISPADGRIVDVKDNVPLPNDIDSEKTDETTTRISIFLSVFDVHVNRVPCSGTVIKTVYHPGKFLNAAMDKASEDNERSSTLLELPGKQRLVFVQIAGLVARRIINNLKQGQDVETGTRMGIIRFGSRVDIYLPKGITPLVCVGQKTIGGETILADMNSNAPSCTGKAI